MKVYALSDLHLSFEEDKPMNVFGERWDNYEQRIQNNWNNIVAEDDVVIIAGDISWAMQIENTKKDFDFIGALNGKKIIVRGNHDYWWKAISTVRDNIPSGVLALQNDAIKIGDVIFCGTRGWTTEEEGKNPTDQDEKIYKRELIRLEMALQRAEALRTNKEQVVCIMHYPPFNSSLGDSQFTSIIEKYGVNACVYGHLHGYVKYPTEEFEKNGVRYILSSCDKVDFSPVKVL